MLVGDLQYMHLHARQANGTRDANGCLICTDTHPSCSCGAGQQCILIGRSCDQCPVATCLADDSGSSSGGVSKGAVAAAVVVTILVLAATVAGFFWYRRRQRLLQQRAMEEENKPDVPARAEDVLNRPDPNEKPKSPLPQFSNIRIYPGPIQDAIDLDPESIGIGRHITNGQFAQNPFEDNHSIQTTSTNTQSNVIPIALVAPGSVGSGASLSAQSHEPGVHGRGEMNLDHVNVSNDTLGHRTAPTGRSGDDVNKRASYMTTGSYVSDFLDTSVIGTVKQVVGVARAEVLRAPAGDSLSRSSTQSRAARSPLAASSFGPEDVVLEVSGEQEVAVAANPFSDTNSPYSHGSPTPSATTFGTPEPPYSADNRTDSRGGWLQEDPGHLYGLSSYADRPSSVYTQASAITADINSARRVHLGFDQMHMPMTPPSAALSSPRMPYRLTSAKLVSPLVGHSAAIQTGASNAAGALEQQQALAMKELHPDSGKRISMSSVDTRADSILESFPFVPPSPISNLPPRTPPRSPLGQQAFSTAQEEHGLSAREMVNRARASASSLTTLSSLAPPNRKVLAMSVVSQSSTVSNGLGSFPFQIESGPSSDAGMSTAPSSFGGESQRKRASLDTLALTSDLSSYPLGFDKDSPPVPRR